MASEVNIATNSLKMFYNYRSRLLVDLRKNSRINFFLSETPDCLPRFEESMLVYSNAARSAGAVRFLLDLVAVVRLIGRADGSWLVFTARNILLFGVAALLRQKTLEIAYFAGLGRGISVELLRRSTIYRLAVRLALCRYRKVICLNERDRELLSGIHPDVVMFYGEGFELSMGEKEVNGAPKKPLFDFGFVGRFTNEKGARFFLELARTNPHRSFVIYGNVDDDFIEDISILRNIFRAGFCDDKSEIYGSFGSLLHLSNLNEGLPFVFFECVQYGVPLIALDNPTTNDILHAMGALVAPIGTRQLEFLERYKSVLRVPSESVVSFSYQRTNRRLLEWL